MLKTYEEIIKKYALNEENFAIQNNDQNHASLLIKTFFEVGKEEVCFFTGNLYPGVYGNHELIDSAIDFLNGKESTKLRIVFQDRESQNDILGGEFLKRILAEVKRPEAIEVFSADKKFDGVSNHFSIMDKKAYRYELDKDKMKAVANFGDKNTAEALSKIFDALTKYSRKVNLARLNWAT